MLSINYSPVFRAHAFLSNRFLSSPAPQMKLRNNVDSDENQKCNNCTLPWMGTENDSAVSNISGGCSMFNLQRLIDFSIFPCFANWMRNINAAINGVCMAMLQIPVIDGRPPSLTHGYDGARMQSVRFIWRIVVCKRCPIKVEFRMDADSCSKAQLNSKYAYCLLSGCTYAHTGSGRG